MQVFLKLLLCIYLFVFGCVITLTVEIQHDLSWFQDHCLYLGFTADAYCNYQLCFMQLYVQI